MRWIRSWFWYFIGDLACKILESNDIDEEWCDRWYQRYNKAMNKSFSAQGENDGLWWPWGGRA